MSTLSATPTEHPHGLPSGPTHPDIIVVQACSELLDTPPRPEILERATSFCPHGCVGIKERLFYMLNRRLGIRKAHELDSIEPKRWLVVRLLVQLDEVVECITTVEQHGVERRVGSSRVGIQKGAEEVAIA